MPELLINAPPEVMPVPFKVSALALVIAVPLRSSTAPVATNTVELAAPKAATLPTFKVPALMLMLPVKELPPDSVKVLLAEVSFVRLPAPLMMPDSVCAAEEDANKDAPLAMLILPA